MSTPDEVHLIAGTRPEAIKLAPVATAMNTVGRLKPVMIASGQHPTMVHEALEVFSQKPDIEIQVNRKKGSQSELLTEIIRHLDELFADRTPAAVVVQGDTTTTLAGAMAAFWRHIPVIHLEAGLRSGDLESPFPEEGNRRLVGQLARLHLAPTTTAAHNLLAQKIPADHIIITGNTVVDAALEVTGRQVPFDDPRITDAVNAAESRGNRIILVTAHRRESWGEPLDRVLEAVRQLVNRYSDITIVIPSHPNPAVRQQITAKLGKTDRIIITNPLPYAQMARLLSVTYLALTDSGGLQEEAPSFRVPVLVLRDVTERVESLDAGCARLVGTNTSLIVTEASKLLEDKIACLNMTAVGNPYGDGLASYRTEQAIAALLGLTTMPDPMPTPEYSSIAIDLSSIVATTGSTA